MKTRTYVYAIEIAATAEKVWGALTSNDFWRTFSGPVKSDWKTGSSIQFLTEEGALYCEGKIIQADPPKLLIHTWPEPEADPAPPADPQITWRIENAGATGTVKLTMTHEGLTENSYQCMKGGWPSILEGLRTLA